VQLQRALTTPVLFRQMKIKRINLETEGASIEDGEGIGTLPLEDAGIEALYGEILSRQHAHLGHST
jgi:hypothetical protein